MAISRWSDETFIELFETIGPAAMAEKNGAPIVRNIYARRSRLEDKYKRQIVGPDHDRVTSATRVGASHTYHLHREVENGVVLIASDAHYWPNYITTAHKAFVRFCAEMKPKYVVMNGDALDGATISRHPPIGWEHRPSMVDEVETVKERLGEITKAAKNAKFIWPLGNHDGRFETRLATVAPEYAKLHGFHLRDHFPEWWPCWLVEFNDSLVVKHRFKGGIGAGRANALNSGKSMATGHDHKLNVTALTDYTGTRWGIQTGTLAEPEGPQFVDYTEGNPKDWRSGFIVATFRKGRLMEPEKVAVIGDGLVDFRGETIRV